MAEEGKNQATVDCDKKKEDPEMTLFEGSVGLPLKSGTFYPPKAQLLTSWIIVTYELAVESSMKVGTPDPPEKAEGEVKNYAAGVLNRIPLAEFAANFESAQWNGDWGLKEVQIASVDAEQVVTIASLTLGTGTVKVPDFAGNKNKLTLVEFTLSIETASIDLKNKTATIFPIEGAIEVPLMADLLPKGWLVKGEAKLVFKLRAGINGWKLAADAGIKVGAAAEEGEGGLAAVAEVLGVSTSVLIVATVVSLVILIVLEDLLYGGVDDFNSLDARANAACDAFAAAVIPGLQAGGAPAPTTGTSAPNADGFSFGQKLRQQQLQQWQQSTPDVVTKAMAGPPTMTMEDVLTGAYKEGTLASDLQAKARAGYLPIAHLKIATLFCQQHSSAHAMMAACIENWWVGSNKTYNNIITPAGWANVPANLQTIYLSLTPPGDGEYGERMHIQGVDKGF